MKPNILKEQIGKLKTTLIANIALLFTVLLEAMQLILSVP